MKGRQTKRFWLPYEEAILRRFYPNTKTGYLAIALRRSCGSVYEHAAVSGLKKSAEWLASGEGCALRRHPEIRAVGSFKKDHVPWNKGLKHEPGYAPGRMAETQFKKGHKPSKWVPIGSTRFSKEGYLQRKISDTGYPLRDWVGEHILIWQKAHGPVPKSHAIAFKDGDKAHIALKNLEMVSRAELMRRNSVHNLPEELQAVIQLSGALKRKVRILSEKQAE